MREDREACVGDYRTDLLACVNGNCDWEVHPNIDWAAEHFRVLRGHDLACWCPLDQACSADVLMKLANEI